MANVSCCIAISTIPLVALIQVQHSSPCFNYYTNGMTVSFLWRTSEESVERWGRNLRLTHLFSLSSIFCIILQIEMAVICLLSHMGIWCTSTLYHQWTNECVRYRWRMVGYWCMCRWQIAGGLGCSPGEYKRRLEWVWICHRLEKQPVVNLLGILWATSSNNYM